MRTLSCEYSLLSRIEDPTSFSREQKIAQDSAPTDVSVHLISGLEDESVATKQLSLLLF
jgi:hypothetical protein